MKILLSPECHGKLFDLLRESNRRKGARGNVEYLLAAADRIETALGFVKCLHWRVYSSFAHETNGWMKLNV